MVWDKHDYDWGYVVLGRDERAIFRAIHQGVSRPDSDTARKDLHLKLPYFAITGDKIFPQGDSVIKKKFEILKPVVPGEKLNKTFCMLTDGKGFSSAREIMSEIAYCFEDPDGNYVQQFQTTGFDARLWELFLYAFLNENKFFIDRRFPAPDYLCEKYDQTIFLEAATVNPSQGDKYIQASPETEADRQRLADYAAIKFGGVLFSKLTRPKRYWELDHVRGKPLIFAIADFHQPHSMLWTHPFLLQYLYGLRPATGSKVGEVTYIGITEHIFDGKEIPSRFFFQPECENVSAVLFSNSGTISKFNRMGKLAGLSCPP